MRDLDLLASIADNIGGKTLCPFGDAEIAPVLSTLQHFRDEYEHYVREGRSKLPRAAWMASASKAHCTERARGPHPLRPSARHPGGLLRPAGLGGRHGADGAQGRGLHPAAPRPLPHRSVGRDPAAGRHREAGVQGGPAAQGRRPLRLHAGAGDLGHGRLFGLRRDSLRRADGLLRPAARAHPAEGLRRQRRRPRAVCRHLDGRLRHRARGLEQQQQVLAAWRAAQLGADDQLRAVLRALAGLGAAGRQLALAHRGGERAGGLLVGRHPEVVRLPAIRSASSSS